MEIITKNRLLHIGSTHSRTDYLNILFVTDSERPSYEEQFLKDYQDVSSANEQYIDPQRYMLDENSDFIKLAHLIYEEDFTQITIYTSNGSEHTQKVLEEIEVELQIVLDNAIDLASIMDSERVIILTNLDKLRHIEETEPKEPLTLDRVMKVKW